MHVIKSEIDLSERLLQARLDCIDISELIGVCKGVLADGEVNLKEASFIYQWLEDYKDVIHIWPANVLYSTLGKVLEDANLTREEETELIKLLREITGAPVVVSFY
jgi:hypothetical protein